MRKMKEELTMRKTILGIMLCIMLVTMLVTTVSAVSVDEMIEKVYEMGVPYGLTSADKVKIERYFADYPVSEAEADPEAHVCQCGIDLWEIRPYQRFASGDRQAQCTCFYRLLPQLNPFLGAEFTASWRDRAFLQMHVAHTAMEVAARC